MQSHSFIQIRYDSLDYWQALRLREIVLRLPLGMRYSTDSIAAESDELYFVCKIEGEIIASCQYIVREDMAKMRQVVTSPVYQGKGIGRDLYIFSEDYFKSLGIKEVYCHARTTAIPFYLRLGFTIDSVEFEEVGIPHVLMRKRL